MIVVGLTLKTGGVMVSRKVVAGQDMLTTEKIMQTFRMPRELVAGLRAEADRRGVDLTALIVKLTNAYLEDFGLPEAATALLDEDRAALKMGRYEYLLHVLFLRSLAVRDQGPGFDVPKGARKGR
jgi:hypothetical protein